MSTQHNKTKTIQPVESSMMGDTLPEKNKRQQYGNGFEKEGGAVGDEFFLKSGAL